MDNPGTVEGINKLIAAFDPSITSNVINQLLVDENGKLSDFINALIDNSDSAKVASLVNRIFENEQTAQQLGIVLNQLLVDENGTLSTFVNALIDDSDSNKVASLINKILENEQTVTQLDRMLAGLNSETTGQFLQKLLSEPGTVNLLQDLVGSVKADGVIARLLNDEDSGLRKVMWGETGKNDAILDWLYVEIKMEQSLTSNGLDVVEYWESYLHPIMDPLCLGWLVPTLAKLIGEGQGGYVEDSYQFVRVSDIFFGTPESFQAYLDSRLFPAHILPDQ
jgi:hypothetical protein